MQQFNTDFIDLMKQLDELNESYKAIEVSEEEEKIAKESYLNHLKQGYVDLEEFHKAFDRRIKEQGLEKLFQDDGNLLRYSYGAVKSPTNELEREIKKLWVAVFSKDRPLPVGKDAYEEKQAQSKKAAEEKAAREKEWAERRAEWKAKKDAEEKEKARIRGERAEILGKLGIDQDLARDVFSRYVFKIGNEYETKTDLGLDALKSLPEDARLAAVAYREEYQGRSYFRSDEYFSWNDQLIDGEKFFGLKNGERGLYASGTEVCRDREKARGYGKKMLLGAGMNAWATKTFELDSSD